MPRTARAGKRRTAVAASYDRVKSHAGRRYTGMAVGRGHSWNYDAGQWQERKIAPDAWSFVFNVTKRRRGHAPEGSGAPVGTGYHWYILAHQVVRKLNADDYTTEMTGLKYKLAHKRSDRERWNASDTAQRKRLIAILEDAIARLRAEEDATG